MKTLITEVTGLSVLTQEVDDKSKDLDWSTVSDITHKFGEEFNQKCQRELACGIDQKNSFIMLGFKGEGFTMDLVQWFPASHEAAKEWMQKNGYAMPEGKK